MWKDPRFMASHPLYPAESLPKFPNGMMGGVIAGGIPQFE